MTWETIITTLSANIVPVIVAIITAAGSIIGVIYAQYSKVKQEMRLRREVELFDRKQKAYRTIMNLILRLYDHSYFIGSEINWKTIRHVYNEIMLVGSLEVAKIANKMIIESHDLASEKKHELIKNLWGAIRNDLYKQSIPTSEMHIISPSQETVDALKIYDTHASTLSNSIIGITTIRQLSEMDVGSIHRITNIDTADLTKIKDMAVRELRYEKELREFLEDSKA